MTARGPLVEPLPWDTALLDLPVARVSSDLRTAADVERAVAEARREGTSLLYWTSPRSDGAAFGAEDAALQLGGRLVDERVTYSRRLPADASAVPGAMGVVQVERHDGGWPDEALRALALESGRHSRFRLDPRMPPGVFERLYERWIARSVAGEIADAVWVARSDGATLGMVTVAFRPPRSEIGLLAVAPAARGGGVGRALVGAALRHAMEAGLAQARVVTQQANVAACRLYEACGYRLERRDAVYHFWLDRSEGRGT